MNYDLRQLLQEWPYEPGQLSVRLIQGDDGRAKVQLRIDLGILQMELAGRPDGLRPEGCESLLELCENRLDEHIAAGQDPEAFTVDEEMCRRLREEAVQYYHRYVALFVLEEFDLVVRDTSRNLRLMRFCREHAARDEDRETLEQFRPYVLMMRTRALSGAAVESGEPKAALLAINQGLDAIREHFVDIGQPEGFESSSEAQLLRGMREALAPKLPVSARAELQSRLKQALESENYELAAILRDELRLMSAGGRRGAAEGGLTPPTEPPSRRDPHGGQDPEKSG
jgi:hypothetical protein